jgi:hypothetical protein
MLCPKCGTNNDDSSNNCLQCGEILKRPVQPDLSASGYQNIPNYLVQAILVTIFCCLPLGIPAIVFAAQVNGKAERGDYSGALELSRKAKMWSWISFGVGLAVMLIYFLFIVVIGGMSRFMSR